MSKAIVSNHDAELGTVKSYTAGFVLSLALTLGAYFLANHAHAGSWGLIYTLAALAVTQLFVQVVFFLHLGRGSNPRWNLVVFAFAVMVVVILVFGSLWIMKNLSYGHSLPANTSNQSIIKDEGYQSSSK